MQSCPAMDALVEPLAISLRISISRSVKSLGDIDGIIKILGYKDVGRREARQLLDVVIFCGCPMQMHHAATALSNKKRERGVTQARRSLSALAIASVLECTC